MEDVTSRRRVGGQTLGHGCEAEADRRPQGGLCLCHRPLSSLGRQPLSHDLPTEAGLVCISLQLQPSWLQTSNW